MRTYDRETYQRISEAWRSYGPEWHDVRQLVAERGYPFPPSGQATDERDDSEPSQRAIVWRALDFRPETTLQIIGRCRSWGAVVAAIIATEDNLREDATLRERDAAWFRRDEPDPREATVAIRRILERIGNS